MTRKARKAPFVAAALTALERLLRSASSGGPRRGLPEDEAGSPAARRRHALLAAALRGAPDLAGAAAALETRLPAWSARPAAARAFLLVGGRAAWSSPGRVPDVVPGRAIIERPFAAAAGLAKTTRGGGFLFVATLHRVGALECGLVTAYHGAAGA